MPAAKPPEFRRRAVDLARQGGQPVGRIAKDLGISESCLRRWMAIDDVDSGRAEGVTYAARRTAEGKTRRDIKRCLKRAIAREIYRLLEAHARAQTKVNTAA